MSRMHKFNHLLVQQEALASYVDALLEDAPGNDGDDILSRGISDNVHKVESMGVDGCESAVMTEAPGATMISTFNHLSHPEERVTTAHALRWFMFNVQGLSLALPMDKINGLLDWPPEFSAISSRANQVLGHVDCWGLPTLVVDTAILVMPETNLYKGRTHNTQPYQRIVLIDEGRWGLACNGGKILTLRPDEVRWRTPQTLRPWLAGTVMEHMCALIDAEQLVKMLEASLVTH